MSEIVKYDADGLESFSVLLDNETVWLSQAQMAELFEKNRVTITEHINNVFEEKELEKKSVCRKFRHTASDGKRYNVQIYNLDVIISVGYRVKSQRGTKFRQWATSVLREHLLKGYTVKQPVSVEQLNSIKDEVKGLEEKINEMLQQQSKADSFMFDEFGRVYEILSGITEPKKLQEEKQRKPIGFQFMLENDNEE